MFELKRFVPDAATLSKLPAKGHGYNARLGSSDVRESIKADLYPKGRGWSPATKAGSVLVPIVVVTRKGKIVTGIEYLTGLHRGLVIHPLAAEHPERLAELIDQGLHYLEVTGKPTAAELKDLASDDDDAQVPWTQAQRFRVYELWKAEGLTDEAACRKAGYRRRSMFAIGLSKCSQDIKDAWLSDQTRQKPAIVQSDIVKLAGIAAKEAKDNPAGFAMNGPTSDEYVNLAKDIKHAAETGEAPLKPVKLTEREALDLIGLIRDRVKNAAPVPASAIVGTILALYGFSPSTAKPVKENPAKTYIGNLIAPATKAQTDKPKKAKAKAK
jgi:hypothetical protein